MHGWYAAAHIAGTKGLNGKLRLAQASAFLRFASAGDEIAFVPPREDGPRFAHVSAWEQSGEDGCLVAFDEVQSAQEAQELVGCTVLLRGEGPQDEDAGDGFDLFIGFTVEDPSLGVVGIIEDIDDSPARFQPLMSIVREGEERRALIPFVDELIVEIDEDGKRIVMNLPAGILDI